jgi:hypothetical protein
MLRCGYHLQHVQASARPDNTMRLFVPCSKLAPFIQADLAVRQATGCTNASIDDSAESPETLPKFAGDAWAKAALCWRYGSE